MDQSARSISVLIVVILLAREYSPKVWGRGWRAPSRMTLFINDDIDPRLAWIF
jgi:hypothetical protein